MLHARPLFGPLLDQTPYFGTNFPNSFLTSLPANFQTIFFKTSKHKLPTNFWTSFSNHCPKRPTNCLFQLSNKLSTKPPTQFRSNVSIDFRTSLPTKAYIL